MEFLKPLILQPKMTKLFPPCCVINNNNNNNPSNSQNIGRRKVTTLALSSPLVLFGGGILRRTQEEQSEYAFAFEFGFVADDQQTIEEAEGGVKGHAEDLLRVKALLEAESWKEAQRALRQSSAMLKKDVYTIIQNKPGAQRPQLRKLYSTLFNNVTRLDYAARDKDLPEIWKRYKNIVAAVNDILSRI